MAEEPGNGAEEEFYDVPDKVESIRVVARRPRLVALEWPTPCDNARAIERYQVFLSSWQLGSPCAPLPAQEQDALEGPASDDTLLLTHAAGEVTVGGDAGSCRLEVAAPPGLQGRLAAGRAKQALPAPELPGAAWASVRAGNDEGWAEWAEPALIAWRGASLAPEGSALQTWGLAEDGRLGRGHAVLERGVCGEAGDVEGLHGKVLHTVALGSHSAAITSKDELFVWGTFTAKASAGDAGEQGKEGRPDDEVDMHVAPAQQQLPGVAHDVACGRFATVVLTADGRLLAWGPNEAYQCGVKGGAVLRAVKELQLPRRVPVVSVALGEFHGLALTAWGKALAWGMEQGPEMAMKPTDGRAAQLGMPECASLNQPEPRELDVAGRVTGIAAGAYHSALVTDDGRLWTWGSNDHCQLGHGRAVREARRPRPLEGLDSAKLVVLGGFHSCAVDREGRAFTWGDNQKGQCGQGDTAVVERPTALQLAAGGRCLGASLGGFFSLFEGQVEGEAPRVYACGLGKEGCLGFGQPCKRMLRPQPMPAAPGGKRWAHLRAGMVHVAGLLAAE